MVLTRGVKILNWKFIAMNESFMVEYNEELNMYRVVYFENGNYKGKIDFNGIEVEK